MAKIPKEELEAFRQVVKTVEEMILHVEQVLLNAATDAPAHSEFQRNPDATYKWILETQQTYTLVANTNTRVLIESRRIWELGEKLKKEFGVVETEELRRKVNHHLKNLRDLSSALKEQKNDLNQIITSVRSVQSAVTSRFRATSGN